LQAIPQLLEIRYVSEKPTYSCQMTANPLRNS